MKLSEIKTAIENLTKKSGFSIITYPVIYKICRGFADKCRQISELHNIRFSQAVYEKLYPQKIVLCPTCGNPCRFKNFRLGYYDHCSTTCTQLDKKVRDKNKKTMLKRHGVEFAAQSARVLEKREKTLISRYGKNYRKRIQKKTRKTWMKKYGVQHASQAKSVQDKMVQTKLDRYGTTNPFKIPGAKKKRDRSMLERYGVLYSVHNPSSIKKRHKTNKKKYGAKETLSRDSSLRKEIEQIWQKKYSVDNPWKNPKIHNKAKSTLKRKYGVETPLKSPIIKRRAQKTIRTRYGVPHIAQAASVMRKKKETMLERYGVPYAMQSRELMDKQQKSSFSRKPITIEGKQFNLQGYEPEVVNFLVNSENILVKNIKHTKTGGVPTIWYKGKDKKKHAYHPDLYVKYRNIGWAVVEVKSTYTLGLHEANKTEFYRTRAKAKATIKQGHVFVLYVVDRKRGTPKRIDNFETKTRKQVMQELGFHLDR